MNVDSFGGFDRPLLSVSEKNRGFLMSNERRARLKELLKEKNTLHNTTTTLPAREEERRKKVSRFLESVQIATAKTAKTSSGDPVFPENAQDHAAKTAKTPSEAERFGLVASWSFEFGFISLHDPTSGEWHDLRTKDAPDWAVREARKRKELYRDGNRKAFRLTSREIGKILEAEHPVKEEGIVEDYPVEEG